MPPIAKVVEEWVLSSATVAAALGGLLWIIRAVRRRLRRDRLVCDGTIAALEGVRGFMEILAGRDHEGRIVLDRVEIALKKGALEQRITDALEALRPSCNQLNDDDNSA